MSDCPKKPVKKVNCQAPPKCDGTYSKLDPDLHFPTSTANSALLYSRYPSDCIPNSTCMNSCVYRLPNIPAEQFSVYNTTLNGIEPTNLSPNNFNAQCSIK